MFVTGGGLETTSTFKRGIELPLFARNPPTRLRRRHRRRRRSAAPRGGFRSSMLVLLVAGCVALLNGCEAIGLQAILDGLQDQLIGQRTPPDENI
jgi:hypothetical protein